MTSTSDSAPFKDPTGLINLPPDSVRVEDPEEEVFLLYTNLSSRRPQDISSSSFTGLGSVDSRQDRLAIRFQLLSGYGADHEARPSLDDASSHASKRHDKRAKRAAGNSKDRHAVEVSTLEIELVQDKTALRSRKGDTGSVLWRVSVALGQAIMNDLCSNSTGSLFNAEKLKEVNILELGAGTGLLSIIFAPWVHHYTVTDLDYLVPLIRKNVATNLPLVQEALKSNKHPISPAARRSKRSATSTDEEKSQCAVSVEALDWLELQKASPHARRTAFYIEHANPPDIIIIADCVYNPALLPALLATVKHFVVPGQTRVLVAMELRAADVVRDFLTLWVGLGGWEIWRIGSGDAEDGSGWLGVDFAVWIGWKMINADGGGVGEQGEQGQGEFEGDALVACARGPRRRKNTPPQQR